MEILDLWCLIKFSIVSSDLKQLTYPGGRCVTTWHSQAAVPVPGHVLTYLCMVGAAILHDGGRHFRWDQLRSERMVLYALQNQKAVTAHLKSKQLLPFSFARHHWRWSKDAEYVFSLCGWSV